MREDKHLAGKLWVRGRGGRISVPPGLAIMLWACVVTVESVSSVHSTVSKEVPNPTMENMQSSESGSGAVDDEKDLCVRRGQDEVWGEGDVGILGGDARGAARGDLALLDEEHGGAGGRATGTIWGTKSDLNESRARENETKVPSSLTTAASTVPGCDGGLTSAIPRPRPGSSASER